MTLIDFRPAPPTTATASRPTQSLRAPGAAAPHPSSGPTRQRSTPTGPRAVPIGTEARGFVLYVGLDEATAEASGNDLAHIVQALKQFTAGLVPGAQTHAAVALAPAGAGGRNIDVVRLALQEPVAVAARRDEAAVARTGSVNLVIDFSRKTVQLDDRPVTLTYTELELLEYLICNEGRSVARTELIDQLWDTPARAGATDGPDLAETPNERTIDVHVRRLRAKLGRYEQIVRTVRGAGYRFDQHPDVAVHFSHVSRANRVLSA